MLLNYLRLTVLFTVFTSSTVLAQFPGCPNVDAGPDQVLPCSQTCTNLTAAPFHAGSTANYSVAAIPHTPPIPYNQSGGTGVSVGNDDVYSPVINLPFNFCYFGTTYTTCSVGSNGSIKMGSSAGTSNPWSFTASCPSTALTTAGDIFGVYHDMDPRVGGTVKWYLVGTAPCRIFVVVFNAVPHYLTSCNGINTTSMIVLYETTNAIDVYVDHKPLCAAWQSGNAIIGIQNPAGTAGVAAPGRNTTPTWTVTTPEAWRFTPNGPAIYTTAWFQGATQIGLGNTINVCPTATTTYTAKTTYTRCDGTQIVETDNMTVSYSSLTPATVTPSAETCSNYNNGSVTINNPVGAGPYTVNISGPASGSVVEPNTAGGVASFTNLPDGNYSYTVTGANGCTTNGTFTIGAGPVCCSVTASGTNILCNAATTGSVTSNPVGLAPFTYSWTGGQSGQTAINLGAGTYTVTMTDASGCVATASATITSPTPVTATAAVVNASCNGNCNGTITVTASGGTAPYQYSKNGGAFQASPVFGSLCSGSYSITVKDANNCTVVITPSVTQPAVLALSAPVIVPATCGSTNGSISTGASGGTTAYSYSIGGAGQASGTFNGLAAGSYTITVTDSKGCTASVTAVVTAQNAPVASVISQQNVSCFGGANGSVLIGASGGVAPIQYSLNGGPFQASNSFGSLTAGTYTATVKDANGCTNTVNVTITSAPQMTFVSAVTPALCSGACNGQIAITVSGGTGPFSFSSNNGATYSTANPITGLCAGATGIVVKDANGCLVNATVNVTQPAPLAATFTIITNPVCNDLCNGQVSVAATGGTAAYQYSFNGGASQASPTLTGMCSGNNSILVTDAHGCQFTGNQTLTDPPAMVITQTSNVESNCGFNNGELVVNATGNNNPIQYSINGGPLQPSGTFSNLVAGSYHVIVQDALGCRDSVFFGINDIEMQGIVLAQTDVTCYDGNDGTIEVLNVSGAAPITYELDNTPPTQTTGLFTGIEAGSHVVVIYDNGNCIYTLPFTMIEPTEVTFTASVTNIACNGSSTGSIQFATPTGGAGGYQYSVNNGATFQASPTFNGLAAGTYTLAVTDNEGCVVNGTATITQATALSFTFSVSNLTCAGNNSGFIQLVAAGGSGTYEYSIDGGVTFGTADAFVNLGAGAYNIVIRDAALCQTTGVVTLTEPAALTATYTPAPTSCNAVCDGTVAVTASGGTGAYQYSGDGGVTFNVTNNLTGFCAGTYNIIVKDANNCSTSSSQVITQPTPVSFTSALTPSTCGLANGEIDITATGGVGGYTYSNNNGATTGAANVFTGLVPAVYNLVVTDANGCAVTSQETILDLSSPVLNGIVAVEPLCNASCDGQITITATGGTGTLDYSIGGAAQAGTVFTGVCAGTYTITVTDDNGCTDSDVITIAEPAALSFTTALTDLTCFGNNTGAIAFTAAGGTTPYTYSIDNSVTFTTQNMIDFLSAGTYNVAVKDNHNCSVTAQVQLTEPAELLIQSQNAINASCHGFCDGQATVTMTGGTTPYTYNWDNNAAGTTANTATALCAGSYGLEIVDDNACTTTTSFTITEPPMLVISSTSATDASCNGTCDGTITITSALAVAYSVDGGTTYQASNVFNGLCAGTYTIFVKDASNCTQSGTIVINEPAPLVQGAIPENGLLICYDGYGTLSANATGGTAPYIFVWNTGDTVQYLNVNLTAPATFTCTVYDQNGCVSNTMSANVTVRTPFVPSVTNSVSACPGNPVSMTASGVGGLAGYDYQWITQAHDTLAGGPSFSYVPTGTETILLVAHDACQRYDTLQVSVTIYDPPQPVFTVDPDLGCSPLTATFTNGMDPADVASSSWIFGNGSTGTGSVASALYTAVGCYNVTLSVISAEGCPGDTTIENVVCVAPDPVANFSFNPTAPTTVNSLISFTDQSTNAATYSWDFNGSGASTLENPMYNFGDIEAGQIQVCLTVKSPVGCIDSICRPIVFTEEFTIFVPNTFTPDGDEYNPTFLPVFPPDLVIDGFNFKIFDRWGEVVFESLNPYIGWDGTYHDVIVKEGVYTWLIEVKGNKNKITRYTGSVNLLR